MTTKKHSLLDRKVLRKDLNDPLELLSPKNINKEKLYEYIRDACDYCTDYQVFRLQSRLRTFVIIVCFTAASSRVRSQSPRRPGRGPV